MEGDSGVCTKQISDSVFVSSIIIPKYEKTHLNLEWFKWGDHNTNP